MGGLFVRKGINIMIIKDEALAELEREAHLFATRKREAEVRQPLTLFVFDVEFSWDRNAHAGYVGAEGSSNEKGDPRWPFDRIAAASWLTLEFRPNSDLPEITRPAVLTCEALDERSIVSRLFDALETEPVAVVTTWGGEARDFAVLRSAAARHGLVLPAQLREPSPFTPLRLDLRAATGVEAARVHLPEYCAGAGIPSKPSPSKSIGKLVEAECWDLVADQVLADVLATSVITIRHLVAHGRVTSDQPAAIMLLAEEALRALPNSTFITNAFKPWARAKHSAARLRGAVYRLPEAA